MQHLVSSNNGCNSRVSNAGKGGRSRAEENEVESWHGTASYKFEHLGLFVIILLCQAACGFWTVWVLKKEMTGLFS